MEITWWTVLILPDDLENLFMFVIIWSQSGRLLTYSVNLRSSCCVLRIIRCDHKELLSYRGRSEEQAEPSLPPGSYFGSKVKQWRAQQIVIISDGSRCTEETKSRRRRQREWSQDVVREERPVRVFCQCDKTTSEQPAASWERRGGASRVTVWEEAEYRFFQCCISVSFWGIIDI